MKIGIINNALGNLGSVRSALDFYGYDVRFLDSPGALEDVQVVVLAGVGTFRAGVHSLRDGAFWEPLQSWVSRGNPLVGLCLGMHLFASLGFEEGQEQGFGWIDGTVERIVGEGVRVPHIGWAPVVPEALDDPLFRGVRYGHFYFMHSFHLQPRSLEVVRARTPLGPLSLVSAVGKGNVVGLQFHPEKSQAYGLELLTRFLDWNP